MRAFKYTIGTSTLPAALLVLGTAGALSQEPPGFSQVDEAVTIQIAPVTKNLHSLSTAAASPKCKPIDTEYKKFGVFERVRHASTKLINPQTAQKMEFVQSFSPEDIARLLEGKQDVLEQLQAANQLAIGKVNGTRLVLDECDTQTLSAMINRLVRAAEMGLGPSSPVQASSVLVAKGHGPIAANKLGKTWIAPYGAP